MNEYKAMWKNYVNFTDRTSVRGYWMAFLFNFLASLVIGIITGIIPEISFLAGLYSLAALLPGLALVGINVILHNARRAGGWLGRASVVFVAAAMCCMGLSSFYFLALWGAYVTISAALHQKILQKMKDRDENDSL